METAKDFLSIVGAVEYAFLVVVIAFGIVSQGNWSAPLATRPWLAHRKSHFCDERDSRESGLAREEKRNQGNVTA